MNKFLCSLPLLLVFCLASSYAAEEVTVKGKITCAKCDLKTASKCETVVVVKENEKDVVYHFDAASDKTNHKAICTTPKEGSVTGIVSKDGDKNVIKVSKVEFNK